MGINPGGQLSVEEIVGREREIERYWAVLERQSLVLNAERRIGKTSILQKMGALGRDGFHTYYQELERVHSITELISQIYRTVSVDLPRTKRLKATAIKGWLALSSDRIEKLSLPAAGDAWKTLLEVAVKDVLDAFEDDTKVVCMWDEFPLMLYNLRQREGADKTIQLLDTLRFLRASHPRLRFLFTGSIGLHLALKSLRAEGNANAPFNDVQIELAPPLSPADTAALIGNLCGALCHEPQEPTEIAGRVSALLGGFAYHIHHCFDRLDQLGRPARGADVDVAVEAVATHSSDPAHIGYTQHRIETYYSRDDSRMALSIMDVLAGSHEPLRLERLLNGVRHQQASADEHHVKSVCEMLRQDQCVTRTSEGFAFTWPIVKRWWQDRRL
ncbi:MAG TPA: hypothetical protein VNO30_38685 [Kofleriaceae bacterium]|nr:hypothetical protein [Kofleriaceae bacterium]